MASEFRPIARERHANKQWFAPQEFAFAADRHLLPVMNAEIGSAARALPLAFVAVNGTPTLVAVAGLTPNENLLVGRDGRWLGLYIPAILRGYPFRLAKAAEDRLVLCVDEASNLVRDSGIGEGGAAFFDAEGKVSAETSRIMEFMSTLQQAEQATAGAVKGIEQAGLLEDWPLTVGEGEQARRVQGLQRINEARLNALDAEALLQLRQCGGLAIAYAQLISSGNIELLAKLLVARKQAETSRMTVPEKSFVNEDEGSLKIDWNTFLKDNP